MLRGILRQMHLWLGVPLAVYAFLIGVSGTVIVFKDELNAWQHPEFHPGGKVVFGADPDKVLREVRKQYPDWRPLSFTWPHDEMPYWMIFLLKPNQSMEVYINPESGAIVGTRNPRGGWVGWVESLHTNLRWGREGRLANGYGAIGLLLLSVSGVYLVWPRRRTLPALWRHDRGRFWHYSLGLLSALWLAGLAFTGGYYTWSKEYAAVVNQILPRSPELVLRSLPEPPPAPTVWKLMDLAQQAFPGKAIHRFPVPDPRFPLRVTFREGSFAQFHQVSSVTLDPRSGAVLRVQKLDDRPAGDAFLGWLSGYHFGVFGGRPVQLFWALLGLSIATLGPTGVWMWIRRMQKQA
jgi:uncharacterized iron-regulated membrane protein